MKTLWLLGILTTSVAFADSSTYCSNVSGNVNLSKNGLEGTQLTVIVGTLGGKQTLHLGEKDLIIKSQKETVLEEKKRDEDTFCGKKYSVTERITAAKYTFQKADGTVFLEDDTPSIEEDKTIEEFLLCSEIITSEWPCHLGELKSSF
jgi:hypothetical protein